MLFMFSFLIITSISVGSNECIDIFYLTTSHITEFINSLYDMAACNNKIIVNTIERSLTIWHIRCHAQMRTPIRVCLCT